MNTLGINGSVAPVTRKLGKDFDLTAERSGRCYCDKLELQMTNVVIIIIVNMLACNREIIAMEPCLIPYTYVLVVILIR